MPIELPGGGAPIDTPGLRELALWAGRNSVDEVFANIAAFARQCRFCDCAHAGEPGSALSAALKTGELEPSRWASYQKLLAEARYHERSVDRRADVDRTRSTRLSPRVSWRWR
jgi:ribosome biogenesis GTPase